MIYALFDHVSCLNPHFWCLDHHFLAGEIPWQSASWASGRIFSTASRSNITMSSSLPAPPRSLGAWLGRVVANTWGIKKIYLRHQEKYISPGIPCFLWPLQQFGDKTEHFCAICIVLEVEPLARKDIGPGNRAFAGLDAAVSTAPATLWSSNLSFSIVALKLTLV